MGQPQGISNGVGRARFAVILTSAYVLLLLLVKLGFHEMWRDEIGSWLAGALSHSVRDVFETTRYSGHPRLWVIGAYILSRLSRDPRSLQLLHALIAGAAVFVLARYSPFSRREVLLLTFGYFSFFEYGVIARPYALGVLFAYGVCAASSLRPRRWMLIAVLLFLLTQTSVYGVIMAMALAAGIAVDELERSRSVVPVLRPRASLRAAAPALVFLALGCLLAVAQMWPPADSGFWPGWRWNIDFRHAARIFTRVWAAWVPIPRPTLSYWNTNVLDTSGIAQAILGAVLLLAAFLLLRRHRPALAVWGIGTAGLGLFFYLKYYGHLRHHGHLFLVFLLALWMREADHGNEPRAHLRLWETRLLFTVLAAQLLANGLAVAGDLAWPFSRSRDVADYLVSVGRSQSPIAADADFAGMPIACYLRRPIFYPASGRTAYRVIWDLGRQRLTDEELIETVRSFRTRVGRDVILVLNHDLVSTPPEFRLLKCFDRSIVASESYRLYLVGQSGDRDRKLGQVGSTGVQTLRAPLSHIDDTPFSLYRRASGTNRLQPAVRP